MKVLREHKAADCRHSTSYFKALYKDVVVNVHHY